MDSYYIAPSACNSYSPPASCSQPMPHQDTVLLIYVFSIFGLVLLLMFSSFYACHLYHQRLERLNPPNPAPPAQVCNSVQWTADMQPNVNCCFACKPRKQMHFSSISGSQTHVWCNPSNWDRTLILETVQNMSVSDFTAALAFV